MKKTVLLILIAFISLSPGGCRPEAEEIPSQITSGIIARASNAEEVATGSEGVTTKSNAVEQVVFTGDDILWFNGTTKELRFKDNLSNKSILAGIHTQAIKFYINDEYLFTSMLYVSDYSSQIFNSLVFYYNTIENKYFLKDGYPAISVLSNPQRVQELRDENMRKIANEWNKFIEQLKKEERYKD
ncbi:MAG: hypothetical protein LBS79_08700 [Tannerella sp.]|jgi:hypothetical protein|nr:hypothetical protein [Tannerella sp.]